MDFRILGPLEVAAADGVVPLGGGKQRALLAILLLHAGEVVSTDRLIDALWGERPPDTAAKSLQVHLACGSRTRTAWPSASRRSGSSRSATTWQSWLKCPVRATRPGGT